MEITANDFEQLVMQSTNWASSQDVWKKQDGRFEDWISAEINKLDFSFLRAYWVETYPAVLFVKAFLQALNYEYRVLFDSADGTYVVTTNYGREI